MQVHIIVVEPDIVVIKWDGMKLGIALNCKECNWIFKDHGIQDVSDPDKLDDGRDGSHVKGEVGQ